MITKGQWRRFCDDLERAIRSYRMWNKTITYDGEEISHVNNDVIYCKPARGVPYLDYEWPWPQVQNQKPVWKTDMSRIRQTVYKHPESIPEYRRLRDLYRGVEIKGRMTLEEMTKSDGFKYAFI